MRKLRKPKFSYRWLFLKNHLEGLGHSVYPTEIVCSGKHCPQPKQSLIADVASYFSGDYHAFEYKSCGDHLNSPRLIEQIMNYSVSFDYVVVVAQIPRHDCSINPKRGVHARQIVKLGAGLWTVEFNENPYNKLFKTKTFKVLAEPQHQNPHLENKQWIINKFKRYVWDQTVAEDPAQQQITKFVAT